MLIKVQDLVFVVLPLGDMFLFSIDQGFTVKNLLKSKKDSIYTSEQCWNGERLQGELKLNSMHFQYELALFMDTSCGILWLKSDAFGSQVD